MKKTALLLLAAVLLFSFSACSLPSINLSGYKSAPEEDFGRFIELMSQGDYNAAAEYVYNYNTLGFSDFEDEAYSHLLSSLNSSRSFSVMGSSSVNGYSAVMSVNFTTLDFSKLSDALSDATVAKINEVQYETGTTLSDTEIEQLMSDTLDEMMLDPSPFYTAQIFRLDFTYDNDIWKFSCTDDFYSALIGYIA